MDTNNGTLGGGEILQYWNQNGDTTADLDTALIRQFLMIPAVKVLIIILLLVAALLIILKILKVRNPMRGRAITRELEHLDKVKKRDESIVRANNLIKTLTTLVEKSPFSMDVSVKDYWNYNINRANIRIPGKSRLMRAEELHAVIVAVATMVCGVGLIIAVLLNAVFGFLVIIASLVFSSSLPMIFIRQKVKEKDMEIVDNFTDFYLMIHYTLLASASTPIAGIMKSFDKTTDSDEMHRFVDSCVHYIDTYGEFEATNYISKEFREIPEVGKLMRLIRQANEGGDVRAELVGFRDELIEAKEYVKEKRMERLVAKATASFNILMPVLFQAIISAMAIYLDDLSVAGSFL